MLIEFVHYHVFLVSLTLRHLTLFSVTTYNDQLASWVPEHLYYRYSQSVQISIVLESRKNALGEFMTVRSVNWTDRYRLFTEFRFDLDLVVMLKNKDAGYIADVIRINSLPIKSDIIYFAWIPLHDGILMLGYSPWCNSCKDFTQY